MPDKYVPRKYMVRGVLDPKLGVFYEIVCKNQVCNTFLVYAYAVDYCDSLNRM